MKTTKKLFSKAILLTLICISLGCAYLEAKAPTIKGIKPNSGPVSGGNTVVITGTDFSDCTSVQFGAISVPIENFTEINDTTITATAPEGTAGTVDVIVGTCSGGNSAITPDDQYTYLESKAKKDL